MGAVYTGAIELRRLVVRYTRIPAGSTIEDAAMFSCHFAKLTGGAVDAAWVAADYAAVEARFDTWWTTMKPNFPPICSLAEYRWYKDGPAWSPIDRGDGPPNPAERSITRAVAGTAASAALAPPQVACSVTKITDIRKRWGRCYLPTPGSSTLTADGRFGTLFTSLLVSAMVTCLNGCRADGKQPVVWSRARSAYVTPRGAAIPVHAASAYEITSVQADNLPDVIRSRRYGGPTQRVITALT